MVSIRRALWKEFSWTKPPAWRAAVDFLMAHDADFKSIRDDVGGHFLERAADYALRDMGNQVGVISFQEGSKHETAGPMLEFVSEIMVVAITQHRGEKDPKQFYEGTLKVLKEALAHITLQVHVLAAIYLWPRFGA